MLPWSEVSVIYNDTIEEIAVERNYRIDLKKIAQSNASWRLERIDGMACDVIASHGKKVGIIRCIPILHRGEYEVCLPKIQNESDKTHELIEWLEAAIEASFERADRLNEVVARLKQLLKEAGVYQIYEIVPEVDGEDVIFGCAYLHRTMEGLFCVAMTATAKDQAIICKMTISVMNGDGTPGSKVKEKFLCRTSMPHEALKSFSRGILEADEVIKQQKLRDDAVLTPYQILEKNPGAYGEKVVRIDFAAKVHAKEDAK